MSKDNYSVVRAIGDGNCAFNAFILGFCQKTTLDRVESLFADEPNPMSRFYHEAGVVLAVEQASLTEAQYLHAVKAKILDIRERDASKLQKALAPYMRHLACDLKYTEASKPDLFHVLYAAYLDTKTPPSFFSTLWTSLVGTTTRPDDIFSRHPAIVAKFKELREVRPQRSDQDDQDALAAWWDQEGFRIFVEKMRQPGSWAGDAELVALAKHFKVNLQIKTPKFNRQFNHEYGCLQGDNLTQALLAQLVNRGIIEPPMGEQAVFPFILQPEAIRCRLEAIPGVEESIDTLPEEGFKYSPVNNLPAASISELRARGLVTMRDKKLVFSSTKPDTLAAIRPISDDRSVIDDILTCIHDKSPIIALENLGGHWNLLTKTTVSEPKTRKGLEDNNLAVSTEKWTKWREEIENKYKDRVEVSQSERVAYTLYKADGGEKIIYVTKDEQIAGDEALARKLQEEQYATFPGRKP